MASRDPRNWSSKPTYLYASSDGVNAADAALSGIRRVHVGGDLLQVLHQPRLEFRDRRDMIAERRHRGFGTAVRVARGVRVSIEMIDQLRVERELPLEIRTDDAPDESRQPAPKAGAARRFRGERVPGLVERGELLLVE